MWVCVHARKRNIVKAQLRKKHSRVNCDELCVRVAL